MHQSRRGGAEGRDEWAGHMPDAKIPDRCTAGPLTIVVALLCLLLAAFFFIPPPSVPPDGAAAEARGRASLAARYRCTGRAALCDSDGRGAEKRAQAAGTCIAPARRVEPASSAVVAVRSLERWRSNAAIHEMTAAVSCQCQAPARSPSAGTGHRMPST